MSKSRLSETLYRLFLFGWIFAVLWIKEYYWLIFTIALVLLFFNTYLAFAAEASKENARTRAAQARARMRKRRTGSAEHSSDEPSWREPKPQWSTAPDPKP